MSTILDALQLALTAVFVGVVLGTCVVLAVCAFDVVRDAWLDWRGK